MGSLNVLALNSGSSSLKFGLYRVDLAGAEKLFGESVWTADHPDPITRVVGVLAASGMPPPDAIGHRIVHGGPVLRHLHAACAPLHAPAALALIGENDAQVRIEICTGLAWIGVSLDEARNRAASNPFSLIGDGASRGQVLVLASQEDEQIARHAWALLA